MLPRRYSHFNIQHRIINLCQSVLLFFNCSAPFGWCGCLRLRLRLSWFPVTCPEAEGQGNCFFRSDQNVFVYCRSRKTLFVMIQMMELLKWNQLMFSFSELIFKAQGSSVKQKLSLVTVA